VGDWLYPSGAGDDRQDRTAPSVALVATQMACSWDVEADLDKA
jgi:hypothetical protein